MTRHRPVIGGNSSREWQPEWRYLHGRCAFNMQSMEGWIPVAVQTPSCHNRSTQRSNCSHALISVFKLALVVSVPLAPSLSVSPPVAVPTRRLPARPSQLTSFVRLNLSALAAAAWPLVLKRWLPPPAEALPAPTSPVEWHDEEIGAPTRHDGKYKQKKPLFR